LTTGGPHRWSINAKPDVGGSGNEGVREARGDIALERSCTDGIVARLSNGVIFP
jgi:hypothetical protein